jgi:ankyrin repeat protein
VVKLLLETGMVDVDSRDVNDRTPLWWAAEGGHEAVVKLLQSKVKDRIWIQRRKTFIGSIQGGSKVHF